MEADNLYSRQDNPHAPPSDPKANVIKKKQEKSHFRPHDGPPMNNGWYETPPDMPNEEDKSDGTEGEDLYSEPAL